MKHLVIIGARGWGREVFAGAKCTKEYLAGEYDIKGFLDDKADALDGLRGEYPPILGPVETYKVQEDDVFFCALGDSYWRKHYTEIIENKGGKFISLVHTQAIVNSTAEIEDGVFIGPYSIISDNVHIGKGTMIHSFCNFGHDSFIGEFASIETYVFLGGYAKVGSLSTLHPKSSIIRHKSIGNECVVGISSVVMRNFKDGIHVHGNPAVKLDF